MKNVPDSFLRLGFKQVEAHIQKVGFASGDELFFMVSGGRLESLLRKARKSRDVKTKRVNKRFLDDFTGGADHGGIVLSSASREEQLIEIKEPEVFSKKGLVLALDRLNDPQNLGAILRSCAAFSVQALVLPRRDTPPINDTVMRVSRGAAAQVPLCFVGGLAGFLERLKKESPESTVLGAALEGQPLQEYLEQATDESQLTVLCLGPEDASLSRLVCERCDQLLSIEQATTVESLNVSVAGAIILYSLQKSKLLS